MIRHEKDATAHDSLVLVVTAAVMEVMSTSLRLASSSSNWQLQRGEETTQHNQSASAFHFTLTSLRP